jgi:hypothetical protein
MTDPKPPQEDDLRGDVFAIWVCRSRSDPADIRAVGLSQKECVGNFIASIGGQNYFVSTAYQLRKRNLHITQVGARARRDWPRNHKGWWCLEFDYQNENPLDIIGVGKSYGATLQSAVNNKLIRPTERPPLMFPWPMEVLT